jgi:ATP-binding cassette subfamily B protein
MCVRFAVKSFNRQPMSAATPTKRPPLKTRSLLGILAFLRRYPGRVALCLALLFVNIGIEMSLPQLIGNAITELRGKFLAGAVYSPWPAVIVFGALVTLRALVGYILGPIRNRTIQATLGDIRLALYDSLQRLAFTYHDRANTGELISRATTDIWRLQDFLFACLLLSVDILVSLIVTTVLIFSLSAPLGWVAVGTMLPTIVLISIYASRLQPQWRAVHDLHGAMTTVIQENIAGVRVVKAFAREQSEIAKFRGKKETYVGTLLNTVNYWASRVPRAQFLYGLSTPLVLWIGGREVIQGTMPVGDLAKVVLYLMAIGHRVGMVGQFTNILQNAGASAERVLEIIHEPQSIRGGSRSLPPGRGEIRFEQVHFEYPVGDVFKKADADSAKKKKPAKKKRVTAEPPPAPARATPATPETPKRPTLHDVSFVTRPGQTIAVVGPTGSGKSTLVNLIPRFYEPTAGRVLLDGVDIREITLSDLRRAVSMIFQETFLFSASAFENIAYGRPSATRAEVEECAKAAQAHDFIATLADGYDTVIGERGVSLSGGQRQRVAIARAFLMDPRVILLDDATASVDSKTEHEIQEAMRRLCAGRTTFVIAQRLSTVQHADWILVLQEGRLVEEGRPAELLQRAGVFRDIFQPQSGARPGVGPAATTTADSLPAPDAAVH